MLRAPSERLFGTEIVGRHHDPYTMARHFEQAPSAGPYVQYATDYPARAFASLFGSGVAAYNLVVLVSFPLAALFTYLLIRRLGGSPLASVLGGLLYAFSPFHLAHAAYHPHVAQIQWLPLYLLALWLCLERASAARLLLLVAAAALTVFSDYYGGLIAAVLTPVALAGFWWARPRPASRPLHRTAAVLLAIAGAGVAIAALFLPEVFGDSTQWAFPPDQGLRYGAAPSSYLTPAVEHPVLGDWSRELWTARGAGDAVLEQQTTVGLGLFALATVALIAAGRRRSTPAAPALALIALAAFVFSLKPELEIGTLRLPMPSGLLQAALPMFRAFARFAMAVSLSLSALAALGFDWLRRRPSALARWSALGLLGLALFELAPWPGWRWHDVLPTSAHRWLAQQPPPVRVLDCVPIVGQAQTVTRYFFPHELGPRLEEDCWRADVGGWLAARGYSHLLARGDTSVLERWLSLPTGLVPVEGFGDTRLFRVVGPPARLSLEIATGFHRAEIQRGEPYRWMKAQGLMILLNATAQPLEATLELELHAFEGPRSLVAAVDEWQTTLQVGDQPGVYSIGPFVLPPGQRVLRLRTLEPAVVADDVLGNGDPRELSLAVWDWRWLE